MRRFKQISRGFLGLTLLAMLLATLSTSCAQDELFNCCECQFNTCTDSMGATVTQKPCTCAPDGPFTYEECGLFCQDTLPVRLKMGGFSCAKADSSYAKNSCSPGTPVGN